MLPATFSVKTVDQGLHVNVDRGCLWFPVSVTKSLFFKGTTSPRLHIIIYTYRVNTRGGTLESNMVWEQEMMFSQLVKRSPWWAPDNLLQYMYTSGVQCITQNKIPIKLPRTKQFGHKTISNQFFWEFFARTKLKQTKLYWKKNQMWKLSQLNRPGKSDKCWFQNMLQLRPIKEWRSSNNWDDSQDDFNLQI